jgi:hypothetical protein
MKSLRIGMLMCLMFFAGTSLARFVEVDGQVVMEAENYDSITPDADFPAITWKVYDQGTGTAAAAGACSGGKYMHIENTVNPYTVEAGALTKAARLSYNIEIKTAGTYYLLVRGVWPSDPGNTIWFSVGTAAGQYGSCQVSRDNTSSPRVWVWWSQEQDAANPRSIVLAAGNYTFSIHQRERNVHVDKMILTRTAPTGNPIAITPAPFGPAETSVSARGLAHTPVPVNGDITVSSTAVTSVSWRSPEEDKDGVFVDDPNIVSVGNYDVYFRTTEPNDVTDTPKIANLAAKSWTITPALAYNTTYYWRVDTRVTWDSNSFTGAGLTAIMKGQEWTFKTAPLYIAPAVTFDNVRAFPAVFSATLAPTIATGPGGHTLPITEVTFTLLADDIEYPAGAIATLTPASPMNLDAPTATLTGDKTGKYKVKVVVKDATTTVEKIAEVMVYADGCLARKAVTSPAWVKNYYDRDSDCLVDVATGDLSDFVAAWLDDNSLKLQMPYTSVPVLNTADIFIEAEAVYSTTDLNYVTNPPFDANDLPPRINSKSYASGGKVIGYTAVDHFVAYQINIPTAGAYTVSVMNAHPSATTTPARALAFGTITPDGIPANDAITAFGSILLTGGTGTGDYLTNFKINSATMTFPAGIQIVRMTWVGGSADVDYIFLKKNP